MNWPTTLKFGGHFAETISLFSGRHQKKWRWRRSKCLRSSTTEKPNGFKFWWQFIKFLPARSPEHDKEDHRLVFHRTRDHRRGDRTNAKIKKKKNSNREIFCQRRIVTNNRMELNEMEWIVEVYWKRFFLKTDEVTIGKTDRVQCERRSSVGGAFGFVIFQISNWWL